MRAVVGISYGLSGSRSKSGRIRVVLLEHDPDVKRKLLIMIGDDPSYVAVASADSWDECEPLLEEHNPELLVADADQIPARLRFEASEFPLVVRLREVNPDDQTAIQQYFQELRRELLQARHEIYIRKASQLSMLLDRYLAGLNRVSYLATLRICQAGSILDLAVADIHTIEASGNYVRISAAGETYILRETISGLHSKLDPSIFVRVHRSYIVNIGYIVHISPPDSTACLLQLSNGQTIPVGPNYRGELTHIAGSIGKLIA
jgi:hypothetical protein